MSISSLSPLDGRYESKVSELQDFFSESALIYYRVFVEIEWLIFLCNDLKLKNTRKLTSAEIKKLRSIYENFDDKSALQVKDFESVTNHDVKAVEYFIKKNLEKGSIKDMLEFVHFACTSEDINNLSYALMLQDGINESMLASLEDILDKIEEKAKKYTNVSMLARTHGQTASPTTMGKEFMNVYKRIERQVENLVAIDILGKINGAVGNFNAHFIAYPEVNWIKASEKFIELLGLNANLYTTQIEPHDFMAEIFDCLKRINTILIDFDRDIWTYISLGYFKQKLKEGEVGSSTMPHKVNPIDFENSEGNLGIANALFGHFSEKLPISRMQRDLTDSTVLRNVGIAFGYSLLAYKSLLKGLGKLELNEKALAEDLDQNWEVLAEAVQTVMRKNKIDKPYEKLKELTRGKKLTEKDYKKFIESLKLPKEEKDRLINLKPSTYIGLAKSMTK